MSDFKTDEDRRGMRVGGMITLGIGILFLLSNLHILPSIAKMWPMFPIIVGISLIIGSFFKNKKPDNSDHPTN